MQMRIFSLARIQRCTVQSRPPFISSRVNGRQNLWVKAAEINAQGSLQDRIKTDMKEAMKSKNQVRLDTIRFLQAAIKTREIELRESSKVVTDDDVIKVIQKLSKQRQDSIESYKQGGREDLVGKEQQELDVYNSYMPQMMTREELQDVVESVVAELGANSVKQMGAVIKGVQQKVGALGDSKTISELVKAKLQG
ncbi:hypothetical protein CEUSTIGMA_g4108.t1 [Chlamydomonas eustigma]|uniref:Altered inheritance of mitochondria protein 41 n=1 Tax=Chlamydomonas eustigma TaxID=1157962 RepID=A0A250X199_9CHLO|nr:hypothetical protein CEUSTIGMA_g4108.t1 [Chlamydomonas eustigma]|eukprot:GAX76662.1 hypothetical protein CEUSTIGMA_g4108.t1 [Chlamydomonas eustigma]